MKASDYIVEFLISKGINDVFGYPGGMVTHLMDSFLKYKSNIKAHVNYHEQASAFAACAYSQTSGKVGVAYATSGPGATNLLTGICNAYFDSIPTIFITGQVNTNESKEGMSIRQRGFQETDIVSIVKPVTKYAVYVESADSLEKYLNIAYEKATSGRPGPVLLDIPMNVLRSDMIPAGNHTNIVEKQNECAVQISELLKDLLKESNSPCFLIGNGVKSTHCSFLLKKEIERLRIPSVTSMVAFDALSDSALNYGFVGAYGSRTANFVAAKSDLIISIGSRMDIRQVGIRREKFAPKAKILRFDIDQSEFEYRVHEDEVQVSAEVSEVVYALGMIKADNDYSRWVSVCDEIRNRLTGIDENLTSKMIRSISNETPAGITITTDVGQNQVWVAQYFGVKPEQTFLFSGGHGSMGYSLPAAIGAYYGSGKKPVLCITGDGGMQMNIQELQFIIREKIPIKIVVLNNNALGMIRHFQEMYFDGRYYQTKPEGGYSAPSFAKIAEAYGIASKQITEEGQIVGLFDNFEPELIEVLINENTYVRPKLEFGKPNQDQEPLIDRDLYEYLMNL